LGGTCKAPLEEDHGPWSDFEIVDSTEPGAAVGVKQTSTGTFYSLDDVLKYPNYMLGEEAPVEEAEEEFGAEEAK
jgi:hypothetical protein